MSSKHALKFADLVAPVLEQQGFVRDRLSWFRYESESILVVDIQPSAYHLGPYINFGVYYLRYGNLSKPDIVDCHINTRLNMLLSVEEATRLIALQDSTNEVPLKVWGEELQALVVAHGIPALKQVASFPDAKVLIAQNPNKWHVSRVATRDLEPPSQSSPQ
jgi:hypothetical protein